MSKTKSRARRFVWNDERGLYERDKSEPMVDTDAAIYRSIDGGYSLELVEPAEPHIVPVWIDEEQNE